MPKIFGKNPVLEALKTGKQIDKIFLQIGKTGPAISTIYRLAKAAKIPVVRADRNKLVRMSGNGNHQGILASVSPVAYVPLENLVDKIHFSGQNARILILDSIQDPHNFGAIIRSAEVFGVHGIIFSTKDSVSVTEVVVKASAGAVFHLSLCKVQSLSLAIDYLKDCGFWIYAASSEGEKKLWSVDFSRPHAVLLGSEGMGIKSSLLRKCDIIFRIPQQGKVESLNVSVAAGIVLAEAFRQAQ